MVTFGVRFPFIPPTSPHPNPILYLEGERDLVTRLIIAISRVTVSVIGVINLLTKFPRPSK